MKVLITGATGFVGSHLCDDLTAKGHQVFALARNVEKFNQFNIKGQLIQGSLHPKESHSWIEQLPQDLDAIIHTAGVVHSYNIDDFYTNNTAITNQLIKDLKKSFKKLTFIHISSQAAAGPSEHHGPLSEASPAQPVSHYGKSKLESEKNINKLAPADWNVIILRPPMVIGPRDPAILDVFKMVKSKNILLSGSQGKEKRYSFICVHDLVTIASKALTTQVSRDNNVFFTAYHETMTMEQFIDEIKEQLGIEKVRYLTVPNTMIFVVSYALFYLNKFYPHSLRLTPDKYQELAPKAWECSGKKAAVEFNFDYNWSLKKTIENTLADYRERNWL